MHWGQDLRNALETLGLSQAAFARESGVSIQAVRNWVARAGKPISFPVTLAEDYLEKKLPEGEWRQYCDTHGRLIDELPKAG